MFYYVLLINTKVFHQKCQKLQTWTKKKSPICHHEFCYDMKDVQSLVVIMILQMIYTNNKSMSDTSKHINETLTELQSLLIPHFVSQGMKTVGSKQPSKQQDKNMHPYVLHEPFEEADYYRLKALEEPDIMPNNGIKTILNEIWSSSNRAIIKKSLFARSFHHQRRCIKLLKSSNYQQYASLPRTTPSWHSFIMPNHCGQSEEISFNQQDLDSIKHGSISFTMVMSYISILRVAGHIPLKTYVFPLTFMERLFGSGYDLSSYDEEQVNKNIQTNFRQLQATLDAKILDLNYLIIPVLIEKAYKCIIVQVINESPKNSKANIILCNFRPQFGLIFSKAIKNYLVLCISQERKGIKTNTSTQQISTIYLMLPREANYLESGIYMMLYLEFLFAKKGAQLQNLRLPENQKKLHLFSRSLALTTRRHIWDLFVRLEAEPQAINRLFICKDYIDKRSRYSEGAVSELDYDVIDGRELQKYLIINDFKPSKNEQACEHEEELNYYLDPELNYNLSQSFQ